jgi:hypothetical protein
MLHRLNQEVASIHGRMAKSSQELYEFVNLRLNEYATQGQITSLRTQLGNYTPLEDFIKDKENLLLVANEIKSNYMRKEDVLKTSEKQYTNLVDLINRKLDISSFERKIIEIQENLNDKITKVRNSERDTNNKLQYVERDFRSCDIEVRRLKEEVQLRATTDEAAKIWRHFTNFAEYKDLKKLYNMVNPEMQKFEENMIEHRNEIKRFNEIITRFDEIISQKSSKQDMIVLEN